MAQGTVSKMVCKVVAGVAAAAVIGTGIYVAVDKSHKSSKKSHGDGTHSQEDSIGKPVDLSRLSEGDVFTYGNWGDEAIEWRVLTVEDDKILVISEDAIDRQSYYYSDIDIIWASSGIRSWLNSDFYDEAFDEGESEHIMSTSISNPSNSERDTYGGPNTTDKVFLLSIEETETYFDSDEDRICYPTEFTSENMGYSTDKSCSWMLRSPGYQQDWNCTVRNDGSIANGGVPVNTPCGIRPAMWISCS